MKRYRHITPGQYGYLRAICDGPLDKLGAYNQVYVRSSLIRRWAYQNGQGKLVATPEAHEDLARFSNATILYRQHPGDITESVRRLMRDSMKRAVAKKASA